MIRHGCLVASLLFFGCLSQPPVVELVPTEGSSGQASEGSTQEASGGGESSSGSAEGSHAGSSDAAEAETGSEGEAEADSGDASTGTGEDLPGFCGDGRVDPDEGEECDEGELVTAKCEFCQRVRIVFVTSTLLQGGKINGLMSADAYCRSLALKAKEELPESPIVEPKNFKALLATSVSAIERHHVGKGPYRLVNGLQVSRNFVELFTEPHENPINVTERSETYVGPVWTGMDIDGTHYPGIDFCGDWTDLKGTSNFGRSGYLDSEWIHSDVDTDCYSGAPIYCLEQE